MSRPLIGKEPRKVRSIRVEPTKLSVIIKKYGTLQAWFDHILEKELAKVK